jgi:hypothetical protein
MFLNFWDWSVQMIIARQGSLHTDSAGVFGYE